MEVLARVLRTIRRHGLAGPGTGVVAAVSGGSDSAALARLLRALDDAGDLVLKGIAHFNHQLRPGADDDERFCARLASTLGIAFLAGRGDVAQRAREERRSIEDAARTARHEFFEHARRHFDADVVATGHTRDDQAETFLLRLVRGAGARGLAAMHPRRDHIIRPLLDCRRADLRAFLDAEGAGYRDDETNDDVRIPRNRVRAELLPLLEDRFNPDIVEVLADAAEVAREEWQWLRRVAAEHCDCLCREDRGAWRIDVGGLQALPLAVARAVVWEALSRAAGGRPVGFAHVEDLLQLIQQPTGTVDLPGRRAQRLGPDVVLTSSPSAREAAEERAFRYPLPVPGEVRLAEWGVAVSARRESSCGPVELDRRCAVVQPAAGDRLAVRGWRPGDRFRPLGLGGRKKLQDYFTDRKVPRAERHRIPLVVDQFDRIVWVAGHGISEEFRVTEPAQPVLVLRLKPVGGLA